MLSSVFLIALYIVLMVEDMVEMGGTIEMHSKITYFKYLYFKKPRYYNFSFPPAQFFPLILLSDPNRGLSVRQTTMLSSLTPISDLQARRLRADVNYLETFEYVFMVVNHEEVPEKKFHNKTTQNLHMVTKCSSNFRRKSSTRQLGAYHQDYAP